MRISGGNDAVSICGRSNSGSYGSSDVGSIGCSNNMSGGIGGSNRCSNRSGYTGGSNGSSNMGGSNGGSDMGGSIAGRNNWRRIDSGVELLIFMGDGVRLFACCDFRSISWQVEGDSATEDVPGAFSLLLDQVGVLKNGW